MEPIRYPTVNGTTEADRIEQLRRYLYQLTDQLNINLNQLEKKISEQTTTQEG